MRLDNTLDGLGLGAEPVGKCEKFDFAPQDDAALGYNLWKCVENVQCVWCIISPFMFTVIVQQFAVKAAVMFLLHVEI